MKKGTCKHFNGIHDFSKKEPKCCDAGVCYRTLVGGDDFGWAARLPCLTIDERHTDKVACDKFEEPTQAEIDEYEADIDAMLHRFDKAVPLVARIKKEHKGESWRGVEICPVCEGRLHLSHAGYNGHVHGHCETNGCLNWME